MPGFCGHVDLRFYEEYELRASGSANRNFNNIHAVSAVASYCSVLANLVCYHSEVGHHAASLHLNTCPKYTVDEIRFVAPHMHLADPVLEHLKFDEDRAVPVLCTQGISRPAFPTKLTNYGVVYYSSTRYLSFSTSHVVPPM